MSTDRPRMDRDTETILQNLMATPVGRRWLLKAGLGSAAAIAAAHLPLAGSAIAKSTSMPAASLANGASQATTGARSQPANVAPRTLQFALGHAMVGGNLSNLVVVANGTRMPLVAHTSDSRAALRAQGGIWANADLSALTHHVPNVPLPANQSVIVSVYGARGNSDEVVAQMWHVPEATTLAMARVAAAAGNGLQNMVGSTARLQALGLNAGHINAPEHIAQLDATVDPTSTAMTLVMLHPQVATKDPAAAVATKSLLGQTAEVSTLGNTIGQMSSSGKRWSTMPTVKDGDGSDSQITVGKTTTTFKTIQLNPGNDSTFKDNLKSAVTAGVLGVRNSADLGQVIDKPVSEFPIGTPFKTWVQTQGVTPQAKPHTPPSPAALGGAQVDATLQNAGWLYGTKTVLRSGVKPDRSLDITIYNNFVRWVYAYVQYLGKDGTNLTTWTAPGAPKFPDTRYSHGLALVPQVPTILGIPLFDQNSVDVTLNFPEEAHTARLLYCGLGNDAYGGGWRSYFPADAYPGHVAPNDEVLLAGLLTGILTIGIDLFALATDMDVAVVWDSARQVFKQEDALADVSEVVALVSQTNIWTTAESVALTLATGGATYEQLANGGNAGNIWGALVTGLGSAIAKMLFRPVTNRISGIWKAFIAIGGIIAGDEGESKVLEAIPAIGEAIAIIEVLADAASLAEAAAEAATSPWVIGNEITLSYPATITVNRDPRAASFPVTAINWTLTPKIDGAPMPSSTTQPVNTCGDIQSDAIVIPVTAPFGGETIQWSIVFTDTQGHLVGNGVSPQFPNDDPSHPQSDVSITITEQPAVITADTVFTRNDTVTYSDSAGGYTWSDEVQDSGTVLTQSVQAVVGATVATQLGVFGMVWKQNDRYYLRGIPTAENKHTLDLKVTANEGYAQPPFLLFDSMVGPADRANHVLLEPDNSTTGFYNIRRVILDPTTGAITWDSSKNLGVFTHPISAAALHSSGRVVVVHTDSGRVGTLHPALLEELPAIAAWSAGPGTQIGLLQSPIAVAVTNPGVVIILEAGASQLAAFDLNGDPIKYFGTDPNNLTYTQALATPGTYLDLAVDGGNNIYLLYYTSDGSQPDDYHLDVYSQSGAPFATKSLGVNVAKLAVDFWRSIYGVNFTAIDYFDPALHVYQPSISRFDTVPTHYECPGTATP